MTTPLRARSRAARPLVAALLCAWPAAAEAQRREIQRFDADDPEGRLMAFYSAAVAFSPVGGVAPDALHLDVELGYVPPLSAAQRTTGFDKPEATNLAPVFPRPRLRARVRGFALEGSWVPPLRVFGVRANLVAAAVTAPAVRAGRFSLAPRLAGLGGRVRGPITCNAETAEEGGRDLLVYYAGVCHGNDSDDAFEPNHVSLEVLVAREGGRVRPYVSLGARRDRTRFDIGVRRDDGARDLDHPVLELRDTRPQVALGAAWTGPRRTRLAAELFWAPGSVATVRVAAGAGLR